MLEKYLPYVFITVVVIMIALLIWRMNDLVNAWENIPDAIEITVDVMGKNATQAPF